MWWEDLSKEEFATLEINQETAKEMIGYYEQVADTKLAAETITQKEAWDIYFSLLHACDEWRLPEDRERVLAKIDTKKYNPFLSQNSGIVWLARFRATGMGLTGQN